MDVLTTSTGVSRGSAERNSDCLSGEGMKETVNGIMHQRTLEVKLYRYDALLSSSSLSSNGSSSHKVSNISGSEADYADRQLTSDPSVSIQAEKRPISCSQCELIFNTVSEIFEHVEQFHSHDGSFFCPLCCKKLKFLNHHRRICKALIRKCYQCLQCDKSLSTPEGLHQHMKNHIGERSYTCLKCSKIFVYRSTIHACSEPVSKRRSKQNVTHWAEKDPSGFDCRQVLNGSQSSERQHDCTKCTKSFVTLDDLHKHERRHNDTHTCEECGKAFATSSHLRRHLITHQTDEHSGFVCAKCNKSFRSAEGLRAHKKLHAENPVLFTCAECNRSFSHKSNLRRPKRLVHFGVEYKFSCSVCNKLFINRSGLRNHEIIHTGERRHPCAICSKTYVTSGSLRLHMMRHDKANKVHSCPECERMFFTANEVQSHSVTHKTGKTSLYTCDQCDKAFATRARLTIHMKYHNFGRKFTCKEKNGGKNFISATGLSQHFASKHTLAGLERFSCSLCKKQFKFKSKLVIHEMSHSGLAQFSCDVCTYTCSCSRELRRHQRKHTGESEERRYSCKQCGQQFRRLAHVRSHEVRKHSSEFPYECKECEKRFKVVDDLKRHTFKYHCPVVSYVCEQCEDTFPTLTCLNKHGCQVLKDKVV